VRTEVQPGLWLDSRLALWISAERLLVVVDLHWGYTTSHRARGNLLPVWGDDEIEGRLQSLLSDYAPAELLWLGDSVHAAEGGPRAEAFVRGCRKPVTRIAGNHDRRWAGAIERSASRGRFFLHHGDARMMVPAGQVEIVGHHHPAVEWSDGAGSRLKVPALVSSPHRLILPAFSPWAGGTAWNQHLTADETLWAIAPTRIFPFEPGRPARTAAA
jgi:metallophosphoesterase superfamily enzyme